MNYILYEYEFWPVFRYLEGLNPINKVNILGFLNMLKAAHDANKKTFYRYNKSIYF